MTKKYQVLGVGNAIVDVIAAVSDEFLAEHGDDKGAMNLVDQTRSAKIYDAMPPTEEHSGGSAGNTMAGFAALGGKGAFIGKVKDDQLGRIFAHDIKSAGVDFLTSPSSEATPTAVCMVLVTPDSERTMHTYLGACVNLTENDIDEADIADTEIIYFEGYLWDMEPAKKAFLKAMKIAHETGGKVALTLSDSFCVGRFRKEFLELVEHHVDILFANEDEITSLYEVDTFDEALQHVAGHVSIAALTRSEKGCVIVTPHEVHVIDAVATDVVDTTGAGDLFAAGFLYGITNGHSLAEAGKIGSICAAEIITHIGARPAVDIKALVQEKL